MFSYTQKCIYYVCIVYVYTNTRTCVRVYKRTCVRVLYSLYEQQQANCAYKRGARPARRHSFHETIIYSSHEQQLTPTPRTSTGDRARTREEDVCVYIRICTRTFCSFHEQPLTPIPRTSTGDRAHEIG